MCAVKSMLRLSILTQSGARDVRVKSPVISRAGVAGAGSSAEDEPASEAAQPQLEGFNLKGGNKLQTGNPTLLPL